MSKGEMTRQRVIEEAATIFNMRGYEGGSIQALIEATGLQKGGLYRHFASKEDLAIEAFQYAKQRVREARRRGLGEIEGSVAKLRHVVQEFVKQPEVMPGGCPLLNTAIDADDGNPVLRGLARDGFREWTGMLSGIVKVGIARGEIREDAEPRRISSAIVAMLEGASIISKLEGNSTALLDAQKTLDAMLDGIVAG